MFLQRCHNIMITTNFLTPLVKIEKSQNKFQLAQLTSEYNEGVDILTTDPINCTKLALELRAGDRITINGTSLTIYAAAAVDDILFYVEDITLDEALDLDANIAIDEDNMFVQYQRKTEGTIAGMPVDSNTLGPITYDGGLYEIIGVESTSIKILPRDFMVNEDVSPAAALEFKDASNTGLQVGDLSQEMIATVNIPSQTTATEVYVWGTPTTKVVEVYEMDVNINGKTSLGSGTTNGVAIPITDTTASSTNYLMIIVKVTATSNRIYGGRVTLTQN
mgnify:CR=1 FL=1